LLLDLKYTAMRRFSISFFHAMKNVILGRSSLFGIGAPIALGVFIICLFLFLLGSEQYDRGILLDSSSTGKNINYTITINGECTHADSTNSDSIQKKSIEKP